MFHHYLFSVAQTAPEQMAVSVTANWWSDFNNRWQY